MLKSQTVISFLAASLLSSAALAKSDLKVGVLDMQRVILTVEEGKKARSELEGQIKTKEADFQKQKEELDKMNQDWKDGAALLSEEARMRKQKEFQEKFVDLRNAEMAFQNDIKKKESQATQKIAVKVTNMVDAIAKEQGIDQVFETNSSGLLYVRDPIDLTPLIISKYDKESKAPDAQKISAKEKDPKAPEQKN